MGKEIYLSLVEADWHMAETRKCIVQQKVLVGAMKCEKRDASGYQELVALSEGMLRLCWLAASSSSRAP
jgi:hypothetical protein